MGHGQRYPDSRGVRRSGGGGIYHLDLQNEEKGSSLTSTFSFPLGRVRVSKKQRQVFVYNRTRETFLAFRVKVADSVWGRLVGLLGRKSVQPDSGVWIVPGNAVHTIGMMFSFDLVLLDKNFKVVGLRELVRPFTITRPNFRAETVLELPAHSIFRSRTQMGDQFLIDRYEARKTFQDNGEGRTGLKIPPLHFGPAGPYEPTVQIPQQSSRLDSRHLRLADAKTR